MPSIIVDLDGTLCDSTHREHLAREKRWEEFHEAAKDDQPRQDVYCFIRWLANDFIIIGCTGRNERYRAATNAWMLKHEVHLDELFMRPDNDFSSDFELKPKIIAAVFGSQEKALKEVLLILEDRDRMVEVWRNLGYVCWQVRAGGY